MIIISYEKFITENVSKWKRNWVKSDSDRKLGSKYLPFEILEYVTSFHDQDSYDDTDFYERINKFENFILSEISLNDLDLDEYTLDEDKVDEYVKDYKNENGNYPPIVVGEDLHHSGNKYSIIDGLHRANAFNEMGINKIKAYVGVGASDLYESSSINISDNDKSYLIKTQQGFNTKEDAEEYLNDIVNYYDQLNDIITIYRMIFIEDGDTINESELGEHWVLSKSKVINSDFIEWIKDVNDINEYSELYIIEAKVNKSDINWNSTLSTNMSHPNEEEVTLSKNTNPIEYKIYTLEEFKNTVK